MPLSSPPDLNGLQTWLRWILTEPRGVTSSLDREDPSRPEPQPRRLNWIAETPGLPALERLDIYANAYFERILGALAGDFPATRKDLGEDGFRRLVADYVRSHPSRTYDIDLVGRDLPAFTRTHPMTESKPWLENLTTLEWAVLESIYTDRDPGLALDIRENPADALFRLDPTARLLKTSWAVENIWGKRFSSETVSMTYPAERELLVFRPGPDVRVEVLDRGEARILSALHQGLPLGAVLDSSYPPQDVQRWFARWAGWSLVGVKGEQ